MAASLIPGISGIPLMDHSLAAGNVHRRANSRSRDAANKKARELSLPRLCQSAIELSNYFTISSSSTSNTSVDCGGIVGGEPFAP